MNQKTDLNNESFLHRWSRRKQQAQQLETPTTVTDVPAVAEQETETKAVAVPTATTVPEEHKVELPAVDTLTEHSDLSQFLSKGVSDQLRRQALRAVFRQAKFNVCDGLDVYAEDFTKFEPLGDIVTYEMRQALNREAEKASQQLDKEALPTDNDGKTQITTESTEESTATTEAEAATQNSPA